MSVHYYKVQPKIATKLSFSQHSKRSSLQCGKFLTALCLAVQEKTIPFFGFHRGQKMWFLFFSLYQREVFGKVKFNLVNKACKTGTPTKSNLKFTQSK